MVTWYFCVKPDDSSADKKVKVWDVATRQTLDSAGDYQDAVWAVAWQEDSRGFVTGAEDGLLRWYGMVYRK